MHFTALFWPEPTYPAGRGNAALLLHYYYWDQSSFVAPRTHPHLSSPPSNPPARHRPPRTGHLAVSAARC